MDVLNTVVGIWERIFSERVTPDTDFFEDLEGDSGAAAAVVHWIGVDLGVEVPMVEVFDNPTPRELADVVDGLLAARSG
ncbi:MAG: acyl carrier protein [Micromonosporaceae bacterium]